MLTPQLFANTEFALSRKTTRGNFRDVIITELAIFWYDFIKNIFDVHTTRVLSFRTLHGLAKLSFKEIIIHAYYII